ncbi:SusD/RagB family nutrient-binding outer membrane lipoprotein [Telluribacter sp. SYSU D00476]|uniref:SusD/RagB family nutrient-binding outer membrane lipoprotein n=1 Tax=Telluribacter sp. SYSU D00476 TaxID=2811430 RepID=UPI001FF67DE7|nr:SusD/RagB family nutrient-binding outer membrane lipoprotein [Telluribacter sp. SYSU D00476]
MKKILVFILPMILMVSCVDSLEDYNIDQKRASNVPAPAFFTNAVKNLSDALTTPNVNNNNFRLYVQQWATTTYLDEPRYNLTARTIPQALWQSIYRDVLSDLREARRIIEADQTLAPAVKANQLAQNEIIEVYAWSVLVLTFGDIPYSEALDPLNPLPKFDNAQTVYNDLLNRLDAAVKSLDPSAAGFAGAADLLYSGDINKWVRFGNSLKLRLGMVIADVDQAKAKQIVSEAVAGGVLTSNAENARFPYISSPPNNNPISANLNPRFSTRQDFVIASTIIDPMNELNDPRRQAWFTTVNGQYVGGRYGFSNTYANFSHLSDRLIQPELEALLLDYSEVEFLLAEAVERGFIEGNAAEHYNKAVTASIMYWGGTQAQAQAYLAQPEVAYATAEGDFRQKIGTQKWFSLFNRGWEAWLEWRRLDYPRLMPPTGDGAPAGLAIPTRLIYPVNEQTLNGAQVAAASAAIGGDEATTRLFWDKQ